MSFKFHQQALGKICRICTNRVKVSPRGNSTKQASEYMKELFNAYGISTWEDTADQHPSKLCEKCARKLRHCKSGTRFYTVKSLQNKQHIQRDWPKHTRTGNCFVCDLFTQQSKGGPQSKPKAGRPKTGSTCSSPLPFSIYNDNIFDHSSDNSQDTEYPISFDIIGHQWEQSLFTCGLCLCILGKPSVQTPCQHNYCAQCLTRCYRYALSATINCPLCNQQANYSEITESPRVLKVQLENLNVICTRCDSIGQITHLLNHECKVKPVKHTALPAVHSTQCRPTCTNNLTEQDEPLNPTSAARLLKRLAKDHRVGEQIPQEIEDATDKWVWLKLKTAKSGAATAIRTGGRVSLEILIKHVFTSLTYYINNGTLGHIYNLA